MGEFRLARRRTVRARGAHPVRAQMERISHARHPGYSRADAGQSLKGAWTMTRINRREAMGTMGMGIAAAAAIRPASAADAPPPVISAFAGGHQPRPLTFDPARPTGLSEKLSRSHYDNNNIR